MLWLRATGSTAVSQLIDSFVIIGIAFYLPGVDTDGVSESSSDQLFLQTADCNCSTPLIYLFHSIIDQYLGGRVRSR